MTEQFTLFLKGPLSQWFKGNFVVDGVTYNTAEQYMMAEKARLFKDEAVLKKIMEAKDPWDQKDLGRDVKPFVEKDWNKVARDVVYKGNWHKFKQVKKFREKLDATKGTTLVEVNPKDKIWGVGLAEDDSRALKRESWLGTNWLGEVLTKVREDLALDKYTTKDFGWSGKED